MAEPENLSMIMHFNQQLRRLYFTARGIRGGYATGDVKTNEEKHMELGTTKRYPLYKLEDSLLCLREEREKRDNVQWRHDVS